MKISERQMEELSTYHDAETGVTTYVHEFYRVFGGHSYSFRRIETTRSQVRIIVRRAGGSHEVVHAFG